jgi:hypothetical protein
VLGSNAGELLAGRGNPQASDAAKGVAGELGESCEGGLAERPELPRSGGRVRLGAASQREASVPPARPAADHPGLEHTHPHTCGRERAHTREARDSAADDGDVGRLGGRERRIAVDRRFEPYGTPTGQL